MWLSALPLKKRQYRFTSNLRDAPNTCKEGRKMFFINCSYVEYPTKGFD